MRRDYLERIKKENGWIFDKDFKANLICTDDADSVLSCFMLLHYYPERFEIGYFYDFRDGLYMKLGINEDLPMVGVDLSHPTIKCISNHLTKMFPPDTVNKNDINLNIIDNNDARNYFAKYNLNTFLLVSSLCGHEFDNDIGKVIALLPDSAYKPRFQPIQYQDRDVQEKYLYILGYGNMLDVLDKYGRDKFIRAQNALNIYSKVWVTDTGIEFVENVDLEVICKYIGINYNPSILEGLFYLTEKHRSSTGKIDKMYDKEDYFSFAITRQNQVKYSYRVDLR
ncbi:MAG TPA: hypothetical protein GXX63_02160 [Tissierellia bacterium]|nr:hypothetical protein [Tissierellia bacterium]